MSGIMDKNHETGPAVGGELVIGFRLAALGSDAVEPAPAGLFAPNDFIRIGRDGTVRLIINKSEMGQGVYTALPMLIAEELECDWKSIVVESAPADLAYVHTVWGIQGTGGSTSTWSEWDRLSMAGATAREMLISAAAKIWNEPPSGCRAENSRVINAAGRSLSYGELVETAAKMPVPKDVELKKPDTCKILGKPQHRIDNRVKVYGTALFGLDADLPGMLTSVVAHSPVFGWKTAGFNADKAKEVPGVKEVVLIPTGVAVVADDFWAARKGRELLEVVWDEGEWAKLSTEGMRAEYRKLSATPGIVARKEGDPDQAFAKAARRLSAEYEVPYLAHACMEPLNCTVDLKADSCDIWTGTQAQTANQLAAAKVTGLMPEQIRIHTTFLGGGFGRRGNPHSDFVVEAVEVAKAVGKPVKLIWTREDDMKGGFYRPMWYDRISAGLDGNGYLTAWQHTIVGQSIMAGTLYEGFRVNNGVDITSVEGAEDLPYAIPNILVDLHSPKLPVTVQWWRSVGHSHTAFVVESFLDEAAHAAGKDPFELRRSHLTGKTRHRKVLELAAEKAGWGTPLQDGRSRGIALAESFGSIVAQVAEISVSARGKVRVHRVVCAVDCGGFVNPDTIEAQMESGIIFGLSAALHGAITLKDGRVEQDNFNNYPVLRMNETPQIEVYIVPSTEKPGGVGEPGVPPIAPAVANAVFAATGLRLRVLPMTPEAMLNAMKMTSSD
ncbi:MAG TPA: xanthine dehydrogenase family protein molybdopterin-binding subunit [Desulfomonilia bacterium]|nr:xanthine dehydrogenase family protein molybdopterin-binding subunit [Desulfomonilia bacterium]